MENLKKFTEEMKKEFETYIQSEKALEIFSKFKALKDTGATVYRAIISTNDKDRHGEVIDQKGWDFTNYLKNPIVLFGHDHYDFPIGMTLNLIKEDNRTIAEFIFASEDMNPKAAQLEKLWAQGFLSMTSVGLLTKEMQGKTITQAELLEWSIVPIPANPFAMNADRAKELNVDIALCKEIGFEIEQKEAVTENANLGTVEEESETTPGEEKETEEVETPDLEEEKETETEETVETPENVETPAEEGAEGAEKGLVQDIVTAREDDNYEQNYWAKWDKIECVGTIVSAFYSAYLLDTTPVEAFDDLLSEMISLLQAELTGGEVGGTPVEVKVSEENKTIFKSHIEEKAGLVDVLMKHIVKEGRVLSDKNRKLIEDTVSEIDKADVALLGVKEILSGLLETTNQQGNKESPKGVRKMPEVESKRSPEVHKYIEGKNLIRSLATIMSDHLGKMNAEDRESRKNISNQ